MHKFLICWIQQTSLIFQRFSPCNPGSINLHEWRHKQNRRAGGTIGLGGQSPLLLGLYRTSHLIRLFENWMFSFLDAGLLTLLTIEIFFQKHFQFFSKKVLLGHSVHNQKKTDSFVKCWVQTFTKKCYQQFHGMGQFWCGFFYIVPKYKCNCQNNLS